MIYCLVYLKKLFSNAHANILKWKHLAVVKHDMIYYFLFENPLDYEIILNAPANYFNFIKFIK